MNWYRNNWYYFGAVIFAAQAFLMILFSTDIDMLRKLMIISFMALNVHQFEEYAIPGGFPMVMNLGFMNEREHPERYPLNKKSAFVCNVGFMYPVYILAIIFADYYWVGLSIVIMGALQFFVHGIAFNKKLGTLYNPGMASITFLFIPICLYYIFYLITNYDVPWWNWIVALIMQIVLGFGALMGPIQLLKDKQSPAYWSNEECAKFDVPGKLSKKQTKSKKIQC